MITTQTHTSRILQVFIFLCIGFVFLTQGIKQVHAACPNNNDTGYDDDKKNPGYAWSKAPGSGIAGASGIGVNTWGGKLTCYCKLAATSQGYTCGSGGGLMVSCITRPDVQGKCYPGIGSVGGFGMGCTKIGSSVAVSCPSPMPLNIRVQDKSNKGIAGINLLVIYGSSADGKKPGWFQSVTTDSNGNASIPDKIYSGMHFEIVPSTNQGYAFKPNRVGEDIFNKGNWGKEEMNTDWSCGTPKLGDGANSPNPVCVFTGTVTATPTPTCVPHTISGSVFADFDTSLKFSSGDKKLAGQSVHLQGNGKSPTVQTDANGNYTFNGLCPGKYQVFYSPIQQGYKVEYPKSGVPPTFNITVGPSCNVDGTTGGTCNGGGDVSEANFALINYDPWIQSTCSDMRNDSGFSDPIPAGATCGGTTQPYAINASNSCTNSPGLVFSGEGSLDLNGQAASSKNYLVDNSNLSYQDIFKPKNASVLRTSYSYMTATARQSGIVPLNLASICNGGLNNCSIKATAQHGLYKANGDVVLNTNTYPANQNYIFLINGKLTINGTQKLLPGATLTISTSNDIHVNPNVGGGSPDLEGLYSSDQNFFVDGTPGICQAGSADKSLTVHGSVVVNAGLQGGVFDNKRTLCDKNASCPAIGFTPNADILIKVPGFIKHATSLSKEVAP